MATFNTVYLKWDGLCGSDVKKLKPEEDWCNSRDVGAGKTTAPPPDKTEAASGSLSTVSVIGPMIEGIASKLESQTATVSLVSLDKVFAPADESAVIEIKIKNIAQAGQLVLQVRDAVGSLVYAERLSQHQVWGLPTAKDQALSKAPRLAIASADNKDVKADKLKQRRARSWASPIGSPYRVTILISGTKVTAVNTIEAQPALTAVPTSLGKGTEKNSVPPVTGPSPVVALDQVSVCLADKPLIEVVPWPTLYEELTGETYPVEHADVAKLKDKNQILWIKCRLNELGFHAGPIDDDLTHNDFLKAVRRYGTMRAIGGKIHYTGSAGAAPGKLPGGDFNDRASLKDFPLDALLEHLKREKNLVLEPLANADKLCKPEKDKPLKLFIDGNCYFISPDVESSADLKHNAEAEWLSRPCVPLRLAVKAKKRGGDAQEAPEALRDVRVSWSWADAEQDWERLPEPDKIGSTEATDFNYGSESKKVYGDTKARSKTRLYVQSAVKSVVSVLGASESDQYSRNAREPLGGILKGKAKDDSTVVFEPFRKGSERKFDDSKKAGRLVSNGPVVYFRPSTIAGDLYVLTAKVELAEQKDALGQALEESRRKTLEKLHDGLTLQATTGTIDGWRRLRVAAYVHWFEQTKTWDGETFDVKKIWEAVKKEYAQASIEITPSKPQATEFNVLKASQLKLEDADFSDPSTKTLKNGLKLNYADINTFMEWYYERGGPNKAGLGDVRKTYARDKYDDSGTKDEDTFSDNAVLPRIGLKKLTVDADESLKDVPPNGDLPSVSRIVKYLFGSKLNTLLKQAKAGWPGNTSALEHAVFSDLWFLFRSWKNLDPKLSKPAEAIQKAGAYLFDEMSKVVRCSPTHSPAAVLGRKGKLDPKLAVFQWISGEAPTLGYEEKPAIDYGQENFPELVNLMLLPPPDAYSSVWKELSDWIGDTSVEAPRTASIYNLLEYLNLQQPGLTNFTESLVFYAYTHFRAWLRTVLQTEEVSVGSAKLKLALTGKFRTDVDKTRRDVARYAKTPAIVEASSLEIIMGDLMTDIGNSWAALLDQILRKGLGCRRKDEYYTEFADGMIVLNARVNQPYKIAGTSFSVAGSSVGMPLGIVFISQESAMESWALLAHEIGHILRMDHWQNAMGLLFDHDRSDRNCVMSYPLIEIKGATAMDALSPLEEAELQKLKAEYSEHWGHVPEVLKMSDKDAARQARLKVGNIEAHTLSKAYRPHFCGKCNLKLRGWNIYAEHATVDVLPGYSVAEMPDESPFQPAPAKPTLPTPTAVKPAEVRFIPGTLADDVAAKESDVPKSIGIGFYPVDKAGSLSAGLGKFKLNDPKLKAFSKGFAYDADAAADPAVFRVEVHEPNLQVDRLYVHLEALQPKTREGSGKVTAWQEFPSDDERARRSLVGVECRPVSTDPHRYRSRYLRLVTDEADHEALLPTTQGLLVTDMADGLGGDKDALEILEQQVRVTYDPTPPQP
jgi:hypothetical protein